jgi:uncharacterized repeat protein (TIGR04138 family)
VFPTGARRSSGFLYRVQGVILSVAKDLLRFEKIPRSLRFLGVAVTEEQLGPLSELSFRDGVMDRIRMRERRYDERAYLFVLAGLEFCQQRLEERRHITGQELAQGCRDLALERFGVMARLVLDHWGIRSTADIGHVVFALVDLGMLLSQPNDTREDFEDVYDFDQAFQRDYPWGAGIGATG